MLEEVSMDADVYDAITRSQMAHRHTYTALVRDNEFDWHNSEINKLMHGLTTYVTTFPWLPRMILLCNKYTRREILDAIGVGQTFKIYYTYRPSWGEREYKVFDENDEMVTLVQ